jgi:hypothetical protein
MSHRAIVAIKRDTGFDLYRSKNGGEKFWLGTTLVQYVQDGEDPRNVALDVGGKAPEDMYDMSHMEGFAGDFTEFDRSIENDPLETGVSESEIATIDYISTEAFYKVEPQKVTTYYPYWLYTGVISALSDHVTLKIYSRDILPKIKRGQHIENEEPLFELSGDDYRNLAAFEPKQDPHEPWGDPLEVKDLLTAAHKWIFQQLAVLVNQPQEKVDDLLPSEEEHNQKMPESMVLADVIYRISVDEPELLKATLNKAGILIEIHPEETTEPGLLQNNMIRRSGKLRWREQPSNPVTTPKDSDSIDAVLEETLTRYESQIEAVIDEFEHGVSKHASEPFQDLVRDKRQTHQSIST